MRANIFIVHPNDALLRAITRLLVAEQYRVQSADSIEALPHDALTGESAVLLLIDEDAVGPRWGDQLEDIPANVPRVLLTWAPAAALPPHVTPLRKPFGARELLETVARQLGARGARRPSAR